MHDPRIAESNVLTLAGLVVALLLILTACAPAAWEGVPAAGFDGSNAQYVAGADPNALRSSENGGGGASD